jgi:hypothetical protein
VDEPLPLPAEMDDAAIRTVIGEVTTTPLAEGVRATMSRFAELHREDRLETHDLDE